MTEVGELTAHYSTVSTINQGKQIHMCVYIILVSLFYMAISKLSVLSG